MNLTKKSVLGLMLTGLLTVEAGAAVLVEPHLGYNLKATGDSTRSGTKYEYDYSGAQYGLRLGGQYLGFMAGLDYTLSNPEIETKTIAGTNKDEMKTRELGFFVGYNLPILIRAWGAYYFDVKSEDDSNGGATAAGTEYSGSTKELGLGFTGLPFVSLNLVYRNVVLDEVKAGAVTTQLNGDAEISSHEFVVGVSLPLTL